jgi:uncharacterized membrane protein YkvA (DUF1232 family)
MVTRVKIQTGLFGYSKMPWRIYNIDGGLMINKQKTGWFSRWKEMAEALETQTYALYFACRDPRVPWYAKGLAAGLVAYAFSPIDLIPDFIPVLGYLDDLVILPLGALLVIKMIPPLVMDECRQKAAAQLNGPKPQVRIMIVVVILIWALVILLLVGVLIKSHLLFGGGAVDLFLQRFV